jgi:hypothetical protein
VTLRTNLLKVGIHPIDLPCMRRVCMSCQMRKRPILFSSSSPPPGRASKIGFYHSDFTKACIVMLFRIKRDQETRYTHRYTMNLTQPREESESLSRGGRNLASQNSARPLGPDRPNIHTHTPNESWSTRRIRPKKPRTANPPLIQYAVVHSGRVRRKFSP